MALKSKKALIGGLGVLAAGYLLYRFRDSLHLNQFSAAKVWESLRGANFLYLFLSLVVIYACYGLRALRWQRFQLHVGQARFWNIYAMNLAGFTALFLLGRAGEPVRPLLISRKDKIPIADTFGIYALERILDAACTAVIAAVGLLIFNPAAHQLDPATAHTFVKAARTAGTVFALIAISAVSLIVYMRLHGSKVLESRMETWLAAHGWRAGVARGLLGFSRGVQTIRTWGDLAAAVFYSAAHWWLIVLIYFLVARSFGGKLASLTFSDAMLVLVFTMVGSVVQLPTVGGGAQALSIFAYTQLFGVEKEPAAVAAMVLWLITFASCCFAGVPLLFREGWSFGELKKMREHEAEEIDTGIAEAGKSGEWRVASGEKRGS